MSAPTPARNPMALTALLVSLIPFLTGLAMLGLKFEIGPRSVLYWASQVGGVALFGLVVIGSAFILIASVRSERRDWRIPTAGLLLILSVVEVFLFAR